MKKTWTEGFSSELLDVGLGNVTKLGGVLCLLPHLYVLHHDKQMTQNTHGATKECFLCNCVGAQSKHAEGLVPRGTNGCHVQPGKKTGGFQMGLSPPGALFRGTSVFTVRLTLLPGHPMPWPRRMCTTSVVEW